MKIVIITGAGISADSGISTFRGTNGSLWNNHSVDEVCSLEGFKKNPRLVKQFYNELRETCENASPNNGHHALYRLEEFFDDVHIFTQNVDTLHEEAGNRNVYHVHGNITEQRCMNCNEVTPFNEDDFCTSCGYFGSRPNVVWFGESPCHLQKFIDEIRHADLFISIGTSSSVAPVSDLINYATSLPIKSIEVNLNADTTRSKNFDIVVAGNSASESLPKIVNQLIEEKS